MRKLHFAIGAMLLTAPCWVAAASPEGWFLAGSDPGSYTMVRDTTVTREGRSSGRLASTTTPKGFGTMMQSFEPGEYLGKRVRMTGYVRAKDVKKWAGLWLRVDGKTREVLSFDNMQDRPIKGTSDWKRHDIVLDVPAEASNISFGILLDGTGTVWLTDMRFDVVDTSVPTTGTAKRSRPTNLNFER